MKLVLNKLSPELFANLASILNIKVTISNESFTPKSMGIDAFYKIALAQGLVLDINISPDKHDYSSVLDGLPDATDSLSDHNVTIYRYVNVINTIINNCGSSTPLPKSDVDTILNLIYAGTKIAAVKEVKNITGYGLKEAKDVVDMICSKYPDDIRLNLLNTRA
jgi:hypothetical protein